MADGDRPAASGLHCADISHTGAFLGRVLRARHRRRGTRLTRRRRLPRPRRRAPESRVERQAAFLGRTP